jgi:hypothetical protein
MGTAVVTLTFLPALTLVVLRLLSRRRHARPEAAAARPA